MGILEALRKLQELDAVTTEEPVEILTADILHKLWMMSPEQLRAIYSGGRRKVAIDRDPNAYHKLWMMSPEQLKAIFGDNVPS